MGLIPNLKTHFIQPLSFQNDVQRSIRGVIRNGYLYIEAYNDEGIYKINLNNVADVTLIPFGFISVNRPLGSSTGTCTNYLAMVNDLIIAYDYMVKPDDTVVEVRQGKGSEMGWGRLKSGAGWIALDFCQRA